MKLMLIAATAVAAVPIVLSLFMPNWYLGDGQNAVDGTDLQGERADSHAGVHEDEKEKSSTV